MTSNDLSDFVGSLTNTLIDDIKVIVCIVDAKGTILYANKETCTATGYTHEELIGMSAYKLIPLESVPQAMRSIASELVGIVTPEMDLAITTKSGAQKTFRFPTWNSSQVDTPSGKALLIWGFDVTDEIKTKKELEKKMAELESVNKYMIDRELKMSELKQEIEKLKREKNGNTSKV